MMAVQQFAFSWGTPLEVRLEQPVQNIERPRRRLTHPPIGVGRVQLAFDGSAILRRTKRRFETLQPRAFRSTRSEHWTPWGGWVRGLRKPAKPGKRHLSRTDIAAMAQADTVPARRTLPLTRGDCPAQRPCPHVSCKWHLIHATGEELYRGALDLTRPLRTAGPVRDEDVVDLVVDLPAEASCTLDVADDPEAAADALFPDGAYHLRAWLRQWAEADSDVSAAELVDFVCRRLDVEPDQLRRWCSRGALPPLETRRQLDELSAAIGTPHRAGGNPIPRDSWGAHADGQRQKGISELGAGITEEACGQAIGRGLTGIQWIVAQIRQQISETSLAEIT